MSEVIRKKKHDAFLKFYEATNYYYSDADLISQPDINSTIKFIKKLSALRSNNILSDENYLRLLKTFLSSYIEREVDLRVNQIIDKPINKYFFNIK